MQDTATIEIADWDRLPDNPLVSVIMLAYRHEKFISKAIEGVLAQKCNFSFELIIGEDCSPDHTGEIVRDYQTRFPHLIRIVTARQNVGMHANGDRCRHAIRGRFVALCEGDDYWHHPRKLQMQVDAMTGTSDATLCHTEYDRLVGDRLTKDCHARSRSLYIADGCNAYTKLLHRWSVMTATSMYRVDVVRNFFETVFNNPNWPFGDYNLALYAAAMGPVVYLPTSTAVWRKVAGSATNDSPERILRMRKASVACREMFMDAFPVADDVRRECLCFALRNVMNAAFHACNAEAFVEARARLVQLECRLPPLDDWLRKTAIAWRFPARWYQALRSVLLRSTADSL